MMRSPICTFLSSPSSMPSSLAILSPYPQIPRSSSQNQAWCLQAWRNIVKGCFDQSMMKKVTKMAKVVQSKKPGTMRYVEVSVVVVVVVAVCTVFAVFVVLSSPINDPVPVVLPEYLNNHGSSERRSGKLECVEKLGAGLILGPEDVVVAADGTTLLVTTRDGWVKKVFPNNGSVLNWRYVGGYPCGLALGVHGEILVADPVRGLLVVTEDDEQVHVLTDQADSLPSKLTFVDSVVVARNGQVYFTDASNAYSLHAWHLDVLEGRPHGRLLNYDPTTRRTTVLMHDLAFANGLALSAGEDFLVVCESWKYRCLRFWLEGESKAGTSEVFVENLPGMPDNIHLHAASQTFWLGVPGGRSWLGDMTHRTLWLKHFFARYWRRVKPFDFGRADLVALDMDGRVVAHLEDARGAGMSFATGAIRHHRHLYIGSLTQNFLARLDLDRPDCPSPPQYAHWPLY